MNTNPLDFKAIHKGLMLEGLEISQILSKIDAGMKWQNISDHENFEVAKFRILKWKNECKDFFSELGDYRNEYTTGIANITMRSINFLEEDGLNTFFEGYPRLEIMTGLLQFVEERMKALKQIRIDDAIMEPSHCRLENKEEIHIPHIRLKGVFSLKKPSTHIIIYIIDNWVDRHCLMRSKIWDYLEKASVTHRFKGVFTTKHNHSIDLSLNRYMKEVDAILNKQSNFSGKVFNKNTGTDSWRFNP